MIKIIIDTNVLISALLSDSYPRKIFFDFIFTEKVKSCLSSEIIDEYYAVINKNKFSKIENFKITGYDIIDSLIYLSDYYIPIKKVDILKDKSDNKFLELALISNSDYLITGNFKDFNLDKFNKTITL